MRGGWGARALGAHHRASSSKPDENPSVGGGLPLAANASDLALSDLTPPGLLGSVCSTGSDSERLMILPPTRAFVRPPVDRSSCRCSKVGSWSSGVPAGGGSSLPNSNDGRSESAICSLCFLSSACILIKVLAPCASCPLPRARAMAASRAAWRVRRRFFSFMTCGGQRKIRGRSGGDQGMKAPASLAAAAGGGRAGAGPGQWLATEGRAAGRRASGGG